VARSEHPGLDLRVVRAILFLACFAALWTLCSARPAGAEGIHGFLEFSFNNAEVTTTDPKGVTSKSKTDTFLQRYNLSLENAIYPSLVFAAGGIFENTNSHSEAVNTSTDSSLTQISPFATLSVKNHFFPTSVGYHRREEQEESNGISAPARILETYDARIELNPEGLPPLNFAYSRTHMYDEQRLQLDTTTDNYLWGTHYTPNPKVDLSYQGAFTSNSNAINKLDSEFFSHNARAGYSDQFFNKRVNFATNYNLSVSSTTVTANGEGNVFVPVTVLNSTTGGLSATTSPTSIPPLTVTDGQLSSTPALLVGTANFNLVTATQLPNGTQTNLGLDFGVTVSLNTVYLTVISGTNLRPVNLSQIPTLNQLFSWSVYTSVDGIMWTPSTVAVSQQFGTDPSGGSDTVGFILNLATPLSTRFVKVVITPVPASDLVQFSSIPEINTNSIAVTKMQTFLRQSAKSFAGGTTTAVAGQFGLSTNVLLLDNPHLVYDLGFGLTHSSAGDTTDITYYVNNGLSVDHQFNHVFSGNARVTLQQVKNAVTSLSTNLGYSAGLGIVPLPTLSHNIVYSGTISNLGDPQSTTSNSFFITNSAQLYKGVALAVSGGYSTSTLTGGGKSDSVIFNTGLSLTPRTDLILSLAYSETSTKSSGGDKPNSNTFNRGGSMSASYTPFEALYFTGSWSIFVQNDAPTSTTQNYAVSWAPFRGGALQFNFAYNESLSTPDDLKTRSFSPSVRWNIRPGTTLDFSYQTFTITSPAAGQTDGDSLVATLRTVI
jgi:hypothetical protein